MIEISDTVMLMVDEDTIMIVEMEEIVERMRKMRRRMRGGGR